MDRYAETIKRSLLRDNITCTYNEKEKIVYALYENSYGDIYSFFSHKGGKISSLSIYSNYIPEIKMGEIGDYLSCANENIENGCLYIDRSTSCLAFDAHFKSGETDNTDGLGAFCVQTQTILIEHQVHLYNILSGKEIK